MLQVNVNVIVIVNVNAVNVTSVDVSADSRFSFHDVSRDSVISVSPLYIVCVS